MRILLLLVGLSPVARAQFTASGDMTILGQAGVGTAAPRASAEIQLSTSDLYALRVSSPNGNPLLVINNSGQVGAGLSSPVALLDVNGHGDSTDLGLQLRSGNSSSTILSSQIVFAYDSSGTYRHSLRTHAASGQNPGNSMDFFLWRATGQPTALGDVSVLSLQGSQSVSSVSVHVRPVGDPLYELVVSDGLTPGGGTVQVASIGTHSRRELKSDITYLDEAAEKRAYEDVRALRHTTYRYMRLDGKRWRPNPAATLTRGLIYEDAPESIRADRGKSLVIDNRLANLEMALKVANRQIAALEAKIAAMEKGRQ